MQEGIIKMESEGGTSCKSIDFDIIESKELRSFSSEPPIYDLGGKLSSG
jgi:hypothetical protein